MNNEERFYLKFYSDSVPSETTIKSWYADFNCGCTDLNDAKRPYFAVVPENTKILHKLVLASGCPRGAMV